MNIVILGSEFVVQADWIKLMFRYNNSICVEWKRPNDTSLHNRSVSYATEDEAKQDLAAAVAVLRKVQRDSSV